ncbi:MAG: acyl carrier protein [Candidatus Humimicrobiia bacterium]
MERDEIFEKLKKVITDVLDIEEEKILFESKFLEDFGADSLDIVEMVMAIEEEFNIEIPDEDVEKVLSVNDVINYIQSAA